MVAEVTTDRAVFRSDDDDDEKRIAAVVDDDDSDEDEGGKEVKNKRRRIEEDEAATAKANNCEEFFSSSPHPSTSFCSSERETDGQKRPAARLPHCFHCLNGFTDLRCEHCLEHCQFCTCLLCNHNIDEEEIVEGEFDDDSEKWIRCDDGGEVYYVKFF